MRNATKLVLLLVCCYASMGAMIQCDKTGDTNNTFLTVPGPTGPSGTDPIAGTCKPVDRVRIVEAPGELVVGGQHAIDVTPRDASGTIRSDECNEASGNRWTVEDEDVCAVANPSAFLTTVRGLDEGDCELTATVDGKSDTVQFKVRAP